MHTKDKLINKIDEILESKENTLSHISREKLEEVRDALKKASNKEEIIKALAPIARLFHLAIKTVVDIYSG